MYRDTMKQRNLIVEIKRKYDFLTKAEKKIANYTLANPQKVLFMSITDLGDASGVGETSVFRFCRTLEVSGYQEFKMLLSLSPDLQMTEPAEKDEEGDLSFPRDTAAQEASVIDRVYATNMMALSETMAILKQEDLCKAVDALIAADTIHFFGVGSSLFSALEAMSRFLRITLKVRCVEDSHMQSMAASMMGEKDVAVVISYSGATKDSLNCANLAKKNGAKVISITRHLKSPLAAVTDVLLQCGSNEDPMEGGAISTKISQLFIIDLLYTEYYSRFPKVNRENQRKTSSSILEKMF